MLAIRGVYEVAIKVRELARAEDFYRRILGLTVGARDDARRRVFLRAGGQAGMVVLIEDKGEWPAQHLAFTIDATDIDAAAAALRRAGVGVEGPVTHDWMPAKSAYFSDPDGHELELCAPLAGTASERDRAGVRPEALTAVAYGLLLPALETGRRGWAHWRVDFATMLEDYVAGGLLLLAGVLSARARPRAPLLLAIAWAYVTGMMTSSLLGQVADTLRGDDLEPNNALVLAVKTGLWGTAVVSLGLAAGRVRSAS